MTHGSAADAPVVDRETGMHHARFGTVLKQRMHESGIPCRLQTGVEPDSARFVRLTQEFLRRYLR